MLILEVCNGSRHDEGVEAALGGGVTKRKYRRALAWY
jgi:hypothetical protein